MRGAVLDAGALVGFESNDRRVIAIVARALDHGDTLFVHAGVVAQAWRDDGQQTRLARLLGPTLCEVVVLDDYRARAAGGREALLLWVLKSFVRVCGATFASRRA
jgi:hypothetical protein